MNALGGLRVNNCAEKVRHTGACKRRRRQAHLFCDPAADGSICAVWLAAVVITRNVRDGVKPDVIADSSVPGHGLIMKDLE